MSRGAEAMALGRRVQDTLHSDVSELGDRDDEWMTDGMPDERELLFWQEARAEATRDGLSAAEMRYVILRASGMDRAQAIECALWRHPDIMDSLADDPVFMRRELRRRAETLERRPPCLRALRWCRMRGVELGGVQSGRFSWTGDLADEALQLIIDEMRLRIESGRAQGREVPSSLANSMIAAVRERNRIHQVGEQNTASDRVMISGEEALQ